MFRSKHNLFSLIACFLLLFSISACSEPGEEAYNNGVDALKKGKPTQARQFFEQALSDNSAIAEAYLNLGRIDIKLGNLTQAREHTLKALDMLKKSKETIISGSTWQQQAALACNNMASIAFHQANASKENFEQKSALIQEAREWLKKALELDQGNETIIKNQHFIENWHG